MSIANQKSVFMLVMLPFTLVGILLFPIVLAAYVAWAICEEFKNWLCAGE